MEAVQVKEGLMADGWMYGAGTCDLWGKMYVRREGGTDLIETHRVSCCHSLCVCLSLYLILPSPSVSMGTGARQHNREGGMGL